jgi:hypothetical protein
VVTNFGNGGVAGNGPGAMQEDRFFGVIHPPGIASISLTVINSFDWEADHLQYGRFRPALRIERPSPDSVRIAWSTNAPGFMLQRSGDPVASSWNAVTNGPAVVGAEYQISIPVAAGSEYFRLIYL